MKRSFRPVRKKFTWSCYLNDVMLDLFDEPISVSILAI